MPKDSKQPPRTPVQNAAISNLKNAAQIFVSQFLKSKESGGVKEVIGHLRALSVDIDITGTKYEEYNAALDAAVSEAAPHFIVEDAPDILKSIFKNEALASITKKLYEKYEELRMTSCAREAHQSDEAGRDSKTLENLLIISFRSYLKSEQTAIPSTFKSCKESSSGGHINYYFKDEKEITVKIKLSKDYPMLDDRVSFSKKHFPIKFKKTLSDEEKKEALEFLLENIEAASKPSAEFITPDGMQQLAGNPNAIDRDSSTRSG